jgi:hypothetical protein
MLENSEDKSLESFALHNMGANLDLVGSIPNHAQNYFHAISNTHTRVHFCGNRTIVFSVKKLFYIYFILLLFA